MEPRKNTPIGELTHFAKQLVATSQESTTIPALSPLTGVTMDVRTVDQLTDTLFSAFKTTRDNRIAVISPDHAGYGDLLFGLRTCQILQTHFPEAEVTLVTSQKGVQKTIQDLQGDKEFNVTVQSVEAYGSSGRKYPDLIIEAPVFSILEQNLHLVGENTDILLISEYGANNQLHITTTSATEQKWHLIQRSDMGAYPIHTMRTGLLGEIEDGVLITDELLKESDRQSLWSKMSPQIKGLLLQGQSEEDYDNNTHLGMSYTSGYAERAIAIYGEFEKESGKDVDMLFLGKDSGKCVNLSADTKTSLLRNGFTTVICKSVDEEGPTCYMDLITGEVSDQPLTQSGRTFRILYAVSIPHPELMVISKLAGPFRGSTGDQSQGESYSDPNVSIIFYEVLQHKLSFVKGMRMIASQYEAQAPGIMRAIQLLTYGGEREEFLTPFTDNMMQELGELIRDPVIQQAFSEMHKKIRSDFNLTARLAARVNRILIMNEHPHLVSKFSHFQTACLQRTAEEAKEAGRALFQALQNRYVISDAYIPDNQVRKYNNVADAILHNDYVQVLIELKFLKQLEATHADAVGLIDKEESIMDISSESDGETGSESDKEHEYLGRSALPINLAVTAKENPRIMKALIDHGANVNQADHAGLTPLHIAAKKGKKDIAELLIEQGAQVNIRESHRKPTPLHFAVAYEKLEVAALLLAKQADVNAQMENDETALHIAAAHNNSALVDLLVKNGADVLAKTTDGEMALALCRDESIKKCLVTAAREREMQKNRFSYYGRLGISTPPSPHRFFVPHTIKVSTVTLPPSSAASASSAATENALDNPVDAVEPVRVKLN